MNHSSIIGIDKVAQGAMGVVVASKGDRSGPPEPRFEEVLADVVTRIELLKCNLGLLKLHGTGVDERWGSISNDVNVLGVDIDSLVEMLNRSLCIDDYALPEGFEGTTVKRDHVHGHVNLPNAVSSKSGDNPDSHRLHSRPTGPAGTDMVGHPRDSLIYPAHPSKNLLEPRGSSAKTLKQRGGPGLEGIDHRSSKYVARHNMDDSILPVPVEGPHALGSCKLPLGSRVSESLIRLGLLIR